MPRIGDDPISHIGGRMIGFGRKIRIIDGPTPDTIHVPPIRDIWPLKQCLRGRGRA